MRNALWIALLTMTAITFTEGASRSQVDGAPAYRFETEQIVLEWSEKPDSAEVEAVKAEAHRLHEGVADLLGEQPGGKVTILLQGPPERPDGRRDYPRVDSKGRIHLFKFGPDVDSYFGALAHEMAHAFRFDRRFTADWFFEEGFAEFVALRADSSLAGFPWFDFPVTVVAGQWLAAGPDIPLSALRERHSELNLRCRAQSYALRSAFFDWLGMTHGDRVLIEAAMAKPAGALGDYEKFFGKPFDELVLEWRKALLTDYHAVPDVDALAKTYRLESPIQYQRVCVAETDF